MVVYFAKTARPGFKPMLKGLRNPLIVADLTVLPVDTYFVHDKTAGTGLLNSNAQITFFDNKFFVIWTQGTGENVDGTEAVYSTSSDGQSWSAPATASGSPPTGFRYSANGLWIREGVLWLLYYYTEATGQSEGDTYYGESLALWGKQWQPASQTWSSHQVICDDAMVDAPPILLPNGQWHATGRDNDFRTQMLLGDIDGWTKVIVPSPAGVLLNEATILPIGNASVISYEYRNEEDMNPRRLLRSFSFDGGQSISAPVPTNFPDAQSRRAVKRLSDGRYVLCSNASQADGRTKLMLSVSDNGLEYDRVYILRGEATTPKDGNPGYWRTGYQYPQFLEKDGYLWIVYSRNKEDIQISRVALSAFA